MIKGQPIYDKRVVRLSEVGRLFYCYLYSSGKVFFHSLNGFWRMCEL